MNRRLGQVLKRLASDSSLRRNLAIAAGLSSASLFAEYALRSALGPHSAYLAPTLAVVLAARFGGRWAGLASAAFSSLGILFLFIEPRYSLEISGPEASVGLTRFLIIATIVSLFVGRLSQSLLAASLAEQLMRRKAQLVDLSHDAIILATPQRHITDWNAGAVELYGWNAIEVQGKVIHDLLQTTNHVSTSEIDRILLAKGQWNGELNHTARDGRRIVVESRHVLLRDERDEPLAILEINRDITERKLAEEESRRAHEQHRLALDSADMGTWALDTCTGLISWDKRTRTLFGIEADRLETYRGTLDVIHPGDRRRIDEAVQRALAVNSSGKFEEEFRVVWPDSSVHWIFSKGLAWFDGERASRHAVRLVGTVQDVTTRKQKEQDFRESEERLRLAQQVARIGTFEWNIQTGVNRWTPELEAMYGLPVGGFSGTQEAWERLVHPDDRPEAVRRVNKAMEQGSFEGEWRVLWPDGTIRWLSGRGWVFRDESGNPQRLVGINIDVTEARRAAEEQRQLSEQRLLALEAANLGAWHYKLDTGDVYWDERCKEMFGMVKSLQVGYQDGIARIHPDDRAANDEAVARAIEGARGGLYHREFRVVWPDGSEKWIASHGRAFFEGEEGQRRAVRFVGVNSDITDRRHAEDRLRQTQKLESIGLLAGGIAHDFNNLLTVIMGSAGSALADCPSCESSKAIVDATNRAASLTKQLLAYAGKGTVNVDLVDLTELVSQAGGLLSASVGKRIELKYRLSKELPCLEADPSQVEQILMNLVINAGEAMSPHRDGWIEIHTDTCDIGPDKALKLSKGYDVAAGLHVCLEVGDNGAGMDQATVSRIFDPFFSTKFTGRGLGLAAVHGIIRSLHGYIDVKSSLGDGTTFQVYLPASNKRPHSQFLEKAPRTQTRGSYSILVVDDEDMVRKLACMTLRHLGYEVLEARHGKDALQVLAKARAVPSLVLLDLAMPVMSGDELVPVLEKTYPALKIIVTSGYPEDESREDFRSPSVVGFLQKPYNVEALGRKIGEALGVSPANINRQIHLIQAGAGSLRPGPGNSPAMTSHDGQNGLKALSVNQQAPHKAGG
jgi:PAS domain S-box-containing protein